MNSTRATQPSRSMFASALTCVLSLGACHAMAATWTVSNPNDTGPGSLRWAVEDAAASPEADVIVFSDDLTGTILLTSGTLAPTGVVTINGPGPGRIAISGNDAVRVLTLGSGANVTLNDLTISNGRSPGGTGSYGGGVYAAGATLTLNRCVLRDNVANGGTVAYGGGIFAMQGSVVTLNDCTFHGNTASAATYTAGGGLTLVGGSSTINRCTFTANHCNAGTVSNGGAVYIDGAAATLEHCTIAGNTLAAVFPDGGGLSVEGSNSVSVGRTLLSGNAAGNCYLVGATLTSTGSNLDTDGTTGFVNGVIGDIVGAIDAKVGPLADNGGPTPTMALLAGSPAIDAVIATTHHFDQRSYPRIAEGDCAAPAFADIGAYEYNAGRGLNFDAVDDHIDLGAGSRFNLPNGFTLEAWVRPDSLSTTSGATRILSKRTLSNTGYGFGQTQNGKLMFSIYGRQDYITSSTHLAPNQWRHVAVVFDTGNDASFYVNGQFVQSVAGDLPALFHAAPLVIGRNPTPDAQMWDGAIADVRIWNTTRTPSQIAGNFNVQLEGTEPGLVANYRLDEGVATTVLDAVSRDTAHANGAPAWIAGEPCTCVKGDANCDDEVNFFDIDPFVMALFDRQAYDTLFCSGNPCTLDMDCSGAVNFFDIDPFVEALFGADVQCP